MFRYVNAGQEVKSLAEQVLEDAAADKFLVREDFNLHYQDREKQEQESIYDICYQVGFGINTEEL